MIKTKLIIVFALIAFTVAQLEAFTGNQGHEWVKPGERSSPDTGNQGHDPAKPGERSIKNDCKWYQTCFWF